MDAKKTEKLPWQEQLDHMIRGHQNAQETIRAMDTKSNILFAFAGATMTAIWKLSIAISTSECSCFHLKWGGLLTASAAACFGCAALIFCLLTLFARGPKDAKLPTTVLFPFINSDNNLVQRCYLCEKISKGMSEANIRDEYQDQLYILGYILNKKIVHNQKAVRMFISQLTFGLFLGISYIFLLLF
jgi:hypothetical protein